MGRRGAEPVSISLNDLLRFRAFSLSCLSHYLRAWNRLTGPKLGTKNVAKSLASYIQKLYKVYVTGQIYFQANFF